MEATAVLPYRLKVRLGEAEFDAEGPEESVKEQYALFLQAFQSFPQSTNGAKTNGNVGKAADANHDSDAIDALWNRCYKRGENEVSLHVLPQTKTVNADSILLLIYGFQTLLKQESVKSTDLMDAAKQSGLRIDRIDRLPTEYNAFIIKGGNGKGSRYSLNNRGMAKAQEMLEGMFE